MRYRRLSKNGSHDTPDGGDFVFGNGGLDYLRDVPEAPGQAVLTRLRLFTPEWFLDIEEGTPHRTDILGKFTQTTWERAIRNRIRRTQGVISLDFFEAVYDRDSRKAIFNATISTIFGQAVIDNLAIEMLPLYGK